MHHRANPFRAFPILLAFLLNLVIGPLSPVAQMAVTRAAADGIDDYAQCQIGNPKPAGLDCAEKWTNGILNATHNDYAEDEVVPQRLLMDFGGAGAHSVTITYMTRKDSSGQRHAYDYLATWNYTYTNADRCQTPTATDCIGGSPSTFPIPSDGNSVSPGGPQPTSAHELPQASRQFVMYGGTITGASAITHSVDPSETGSDYGNVTVNFTVGAGGKVQLLFGGHLASGYGDRGWGAGLGSASISGGPYHIRITAIDGESIGNRDNQIMSNAIAPLLPTLEIVKTPDGGEVTAGDYASFTITVTNTGQGAATNVDIDDTLPAGSGATPLVWSEFPDQAECSVTSNVLHCDIASLAAGASFAVTLRALTDADDCGLLENTAYADADNNPQSSDDGDITVLCGDISVDKTPDGGQVTAGDEASFTIVTTNNGDGTAKGAALSDVLPAVANGWSVDAEDWAGDCAISGAAGAAQTLTCGPEDIEAGGDRSVTVSTTTTADDCGLLDNPAANVTTTNDGSDSDDGDITVLCPDVVVEKTGSGTVNATDAIYYEITVSNDGEGNAADFEFNDTLPDVANGWTATQLPAFCDLNGLALHCELMTFAAGDSFTIRVETDSAPADCGELENVASASASNEADEDLWNNEDGHTIVVECPDLTAEKTAANDVVSAGEEIGFTISVSNDDAAGTGTAYDVQLSDPLPAGSGLDWEIDPAYSGPGTCEITGSVGAETLECSFGDMAPGDSASVSIVSDTSKADCATYPNIASVTAANHDELNPSDDVTVECPGLNISKVADNGTIDAGELASYTIVVWNSGPGTALDAGWSDDLPAGVSWSVQLMDPDGDDACISGIDSEGHQAVSCSFGDLAPSSMENGKHIVVSGMTDREDCGSLDNTAFAFASNADEVQASASITVKCPLISIEKINDQPEPVLPGTVVSYTLTVTVSDGPAKDVMVTDVLPLGLDAPTSISDGGTYEGGTRTITWDLGDLADGSYELTYQAAVSLDAAHGDQLVNVAVATSRNTQCPDAESVADECDDDSTVTVRVPELVIDKSADTEEVHFVFDAEGNVLSVDPEQVTWTLTYTLTNGPVTNAVITDPLPDFLTFVSASDGGVYDDATRTITWSLGTLTESGSVTFVTTVDPAAPETDPIVNVATIDSDETAPDDGEDSIIVTSESELGGNPTPTPSVPDTALVIGPSGAPMSVPVELLVIFFIGSLGTLAYVNVRSARRRR